MIRPTAPILCALCAFGATATGQTVPSGPVGDVDSLTAFAEAADRRPLAWGQSWDPARDESGERPSLFMVGADSTVWVEDPAGRASVLDAYVLVNVARTAAERTGLDGPRRWPSHVGYGYESGRVYLYVRQGVEAYAALALAVGMALSVVGLIVWLVRRYRHERRQRRALADAHRRLLEAREEERLRIAQDLHDGPVQDLNLVNLQLSAAGGDGAVREGVLDVVKDLRAIAEGLRPPMLSAFGLAAALRAHAERFGRLHPGVHVQAQFDDDGQTIAEGVRLALFRIAQEAMTNAVKHGDPSEITVTLSLGPDRYRLVVSDDGGGFDVPADVDELGQDGHFGLLGMRERAAASGATLTVESVRGTGTAVRVDGARDWAAGRHPTDRGRPTVSSAIRP